MILFGLTGSNEGCTLFLPLPAVVKRDISDIVLLSKPHDPTVLRTGKGVTSWGLAFGVAGVTFSNCPNRGSKASREKHKNATCTLWSRGKRAKCTTGSKATTASTVGHATSPRYGRPIPHEAFWLPNSRRPVDMLTLSQSVPRRRVYTVHGNGSPVSAEREERTMK